MTHEAASDPYCLDDLRAILERGDDLEARQQIWLLAEAERLYRANILLDRDKATHDAEMRAMQADLFGHQSELGDLTDKIACMETELEILRYAVGDPRAGAAPVPKLTDAVVRHQHLDPPLEFPITTGRADRDHDILDGTHGNRTQS